MKNLTIREMAQEDWKRVSEIYTQGIDSNGATFTTDCPSYDSWNADHIKKCRFVAEYDGYVVGFAVLSPTSTRSIYQGVVEISIYIDSNYQKQGIGSKLMEVLIPASERENFWTIYSSIFPENIGSRRLHENAGFRYIGRREKIAKDALGNWRDTVIYERRSKKVL